MDSRTELILRQLDQLPTLPAVAVKVLEATSAQDSQAKDVVSLIAADPALTARILQLVHRAEVGAHAVTSIDRAVLMLGFDAVRAAVLSIGVFQAFGKADGLPGGNFNREQFWTHCIAVAVLSERLTLQLREVHGKSAGVEPGDAFVAGLLHDLGKLALDAALPKSFSRLVEAADLLRGDIAEAERQVIGIDHLLVGKRLAERWNLPPMLRDVIWLHGQSPDALPSGTNARLINIVSLADMLVRQQHLGYSGNYRFLTPAQSFTRSLGLTDAHIAAASDNLIDHVQPKSAALGLGEATSSELYTQALSQANKELGRVSDQLLHKNRRLAVRARFFEALSEFHSGIRPDAPVEDVLLAVAHTAAAVLDAKAAVAFSCPPGQEYAEAVVSDPAGTKLQTTLADHHDVPRTFDPSPLESSIIETPTSGAGPVLPVGEALEWIISPVSVRLGGERRFWICLQIEGRCIGGVGWGGGKREAERLGAQAKELLALAAGWSLALRTAQMRDESRLLAERLSDVNRQLQATQSELVRQRSLASVVQIAAGAAHEMNNPLMVISGRSQLLASSLTDAKLKASAKQIYENSQRASDIITDLMHFAKPVAPQPQACDLAEVLNDAIELASADEAMGQRRLELTMADCPAVEVDPQQAAAAIAEVIGNAILATHDHLGEILINGAFDVGTRRVVLTILDNGHGMDAATLASAFDPFFSAQRAGRRRGMGLPRALRAMEAVGGSIRLETRPEGGTRALMLLPAAIGQALPTPATRAA